MGRSLENSLCTPRTSVESVSLPGTGKERLELQASVILIYDHKDVEYLSGDTHTP